MYSSLLSTLTGVDIPEAVRLALPPRPAAVTVSGRYTIAGDVVSAHLSTPFASEAFWAPLKQAVEYDRGVGENRAVEELRVA